MCDTSNRRMLVRARRRRTAGERALCPGLSERAKAGLRRYLWLVAAALDQDVTAIRLGEQHQATAWLTIKIREAGRRNRTMIATWHEYHGWSCATTGRVATLTRLGGDALPPPYAVAQYITTTLAAPDDDRPDGVPVRDSDPADNLARRLAAYAPPQLKPAG